jgi:hypothetical protein
MNVAFRPALSEDFDYCERLYFAEMERINRELKLDRDVQVASFCRQWAVMQVRIITLDGADIGWLQSTTRDGAASAPRSCIASSARQHAKVRR